MSEQPQQPGPPPPPQQPGQPPQYAPPTPPQQPAQGYPQQPGYPPQGYAYPQQYPPQVWAPQQLLPAALAGKQFADYGQRVGAWLIDLLIVWTIVGIFVNCALMARKGERNGMTLGKQVLKIRVYREDGQPVGFGLGVLRDFVVRFLLFGLVGFFFLGLPGLLDLLWPLWDERNQTLHDKIVSTYVIRAEQPAPMIATTG